MHISPPNKLNKTIIVLRISEIIYGLLGIACIFAPVFFVLLFVTFSTLPPEFEGEDPIISIVIITAMSWLAALFMLGPAIFIHLVIRDLRRGRYWAWIAALLLCGLYIPSAFIILGIIGLIGLVDAEVSTYFHKQRQSK